MLFRAFKEMSSSSNHKSQSDTKKSNDSPESIDAENIFRKRRKLLQKAAKAADSEVKKEKLDKQRDEALEATFPASDPISTGR